MTAVYLECGLAGLVPLCLAWMLRVLGVSASAIPVRVIRIPGAGAAHP